MIFNEHSELEGRHAFLSPSQYHWMNYSDEKLRSVYLKHLAVERGTRLHEIAQKLIDEGIRLPEDGGTLAMYVNDAIDFKMSTEKPLKYSENCFGRVDAISFRRRRLRIHDLKTGATPAHMEQLKAYAALFCLEYKVKPRDTKFILRIYQSDDILELEPEPFEIEQLMENIVRKDKIIDKINSEMEK